MRVVRVHSVEDGRAALREAGEMLRAGKLVAFPTETVYGLGANALDADAVGRIFEAKDRPSRNPVIVHVADSAHARALTTHWTETAEALARAFWPGALTLVLRKRGDIPDVVTAGHHTVGLRVPAHPVALALLETARVPVAAPSANRSTRVSPTTAEHVRRGLADRVDLIVDGGPCVLGIESTVVDVTGSVPRILRPGMLSLEAIAHVAGRAELGPAPSGESAPSPGTMDKHYAPQARVQLFARAEREPVRADAARAIAEGRRVGAIVFSALDLPGVDERRVEPSAAAYARSLYATLFELDDGGCDLVLVERPPDTPEWTAVNDRLRRAAG